jgi:hypothetical protein
LAILKVTISMKVRFLTNNWVNCHIYNIHRLWHGQVHTPSILIVNSLISTYLSSQACLSVMSWDKATYPYFVTKVMDFSKLVCFFNITVHLLLISYLRNAAAPINLLLIENLQISHNCSARILFNNFGLCVTLQSSARKYFLKHC